jgi:hypothetical protein
MKTYNEQKTQEISNPDLSQGFLREDRLFVRTEPAVLAVAEKGHFETVAEYPETGGRDVKWVVEVPAVKAREAAEVYEDIRVYVPFTAERLEQGKRSRRSAYLDAYRKYQAAVNYGEFERVYAVDEFAGRLRGKDWAALDNVPSQLRYFIGEVGLSESGLIRRY